MGHGLAGLRSPGIGALIATLFAVLWLREAVIAGWSPLLVLLPLPAILAAWILTGLQLARRTPDHRLIEGGSTALFFTAVGLAGLTIPAIWV